MAARPQHSKTYGCGIEYIQQERKNMSKSAIVYWSGTGNTEALADKIFESAKESGKDVQLFGASEFSGDKVDEFDSIAFGCPSMGCEQLEDTEFEPMFENCKPKLGGKNIALFGSYGWGGGEWMNTWEDECKSLGANLIFDSIICNDAPDDEALEKCEKLGKAL